MKIKPILYLSLVSILAACLNNENSDSQNEPLLKDTIVIINENYNYDTIFKFDTVYSYDTIVVKDSIIKIDSFYIEKLVYNLSALRWSNDLNDLRLMLSQTTGYGIHVSSNEHATRNYLLLQLLTNAKIKINKIRYILLDRSGSYSEDMYLTAGKYDLDGDFIEHLSNDTINLKTDDVEIWKELNINNNSVLDTNEVIIFPYSASPRSGNLAVRIIVVVELENVLNS